MTEPLFGSGLCERLKKKKKKKRENFVFPHSKAFTENAF